ncbi:MAG: hypothetical protein ACR2QC_04800 [Gammaproteobacteria bacterium]
MRFRLSPEWWVLFVFADNAEFGGIRKYKIRHSGESLSSRTRGPESL